MSKVRDNVRMYGDLESEWFLAPLGTTGPAEGSLTIPPEFEAVGWCTEDGIPFGREVDSTDLTAYQGGTVIRTKITADKKSFTAAAMEEKPLVTQLYFGHGDPVVTGTGSEAVASMVLPETAGTVSRASVLKYVDGDVVKLYFMERIDIVPDGEIPHTSSDGTSYSFSATVVGDVMFSTNSKAFTATP